MSDSNKQLVLRVEEAWAAHDLDALDGLIAPDLVSHDAIPGMPPGLAGAKAAHQMSMASFPDRRTTIEDVIADGDRVAVRTTLRATNTGGVPWLNLPANGRKIEIESISVYRVAGGKVVEHWGQNDAMALMIQLGSMQPPAGAPA